MDGGLVLGGTCERRLRGLLRAMSMLHQGIAAGLREERGDRAYAFIAVSESRSPCAPGPQSKHHSDCFCRGSCGPLPCCKPPRSPVALRCCITSARLYILPCSVEEGESPGPRETWNVLSGLETRRGFASRRPGSLLFSWTASLPPLPEPVTLPLLG